MNLELVTVGTELLLGFTVDTNGAEVGRACAAVGIRLVRRTAVPDDAPAIGAAVREALGRTGLVVTTGGLGPTRDDATKQAVAEVLGRRLVEDPDVLQSLEARARRMGRWPLAASNRTQAQVPEGATVLPNPRGTAPGLWLEDADGRVAVLLPGVPREMRGLMDESVLPIVRALPGLTPVYVRSLLTAGVTESALSETINDLVPPADSPVRLAFLPGYHGVELRLSTQGAPGEADRLASAIAQRIGPALVDEASGDDLVAKVGRLLREQGAHLATAESCTGGLLGKLLTDRPGSSEFYLGGVIAYANTAKQELLDVPSGTLTEHGSVSPESAAAMAQGALARFGADFALAITGIAGPGGGTPDKPVGLIYLGLAWGGGTTTRKLQLTSDREQNRERSAYAALDLLRRHLLENPAK